MGFQGRFKIFWDFSLFQLIFGPRVRRGPLAGKLAAREGNSGVTEGFLLCARVIVTDLDFLRKSKSLFQW